MVRNHSFSTKTYITRFLRSPDSLSAKIRLLFFPRCIPTIHFSPITFLNVTGLLAIKLVAATGEESNSLLLFAGRTYTLEGQFLCAIASSSSAAAAAAAFCTESVALRVFVYAHLVM